MGKFDNLKPIEVKGGKISDYLKLSAVAKHKFEKTQEIRKKVYDTIKDKTSRRWLGLRKPAVEGEKAKMLWNTYRRKTKEGADKFNTAVESKMKALGYSLKEYKGTVGIMEDLPGMVDNLTAHFQNFYNSELQTAIAKAENPNYQPTVAEVAPPKVEGDDLASRAERGRKFAQKAVGRGVVGRALDRKRRQLDGIDGM